MPLTFPPPLIPTRTAKKEMRPVMTMTKSRANHGFLRYAPGPMRKLRATIWTKNSTAKKNVKASSARSSMRFQDESAGESGSYMARNAQLMKMAAMTMRSNHFHRISRHAARRTRERSWKRYSEVLFSLSSRHHTGRRSRKRRSGPRRSRFFCFTSASTRMISSAVATFFLTTPPLTTGMVGDPSGCRACEKTTR